MDNPEHCQLWAHEIEGAIKNGKSRALLTLDTRDWRSNQEWTIQRHWQINVRENGRDNQEYTIQSTFNFRHTRLKEQSRMENPEHCQLWAHDIEGEIKNGHSRALSTLDTRDWRSNQEWTIQSTVNFGHTRLKEQSRMDNPEHCQLWAHEIEGAMKNGQSRALSTLDTRDWRSNQEWTIQSTVNCGHTTLKEQSRMDNPDHCQLWTHEIEGAIKNGQSRALLTLDTRDWRCNQEWTIQRHWQINVRENRRDDNQEWTIQSTVNFGHTRLKEQSRMDNPETLTSKR